MNSPQPFSIVSVAVERESSYATAIRTGNERLSDALKLATEQTSQKFGRDLFIDRIEPLLTHINQYATSSSFAWYCSLTVTVYFSLMPSRRTTNVNELTKTVAEWRKFDREQMFCDGDQLLVVVSVQSRHNPGVYYWEYSVVRVSCDEESFDMNTNDGDWGWSWSDVEYWIPLSEFKLQQIAVPTSRTT